MTRNFSKGFVPRRELFLICRLIFLAQHFLLTESAFFPSVQWTTTNEYFLTEKDDCNGESGLYIKVPPSTKLTVVCPNAGTILRKLENNVPSDLLHENLIMVDEEDYRNCRYNSSKPRDTTRILMNCTNDEKAPLQYFLLVFQEISASDDFIPFIPGNDYYFISTSDGTKDSLTSNRGPGHCNDSKNDLAMKMKVHVCKTGKCDEPYDNLCASSTTATTVTTTLTTCAYSNAIVTPTKVSPTKVTSTKDMSTRVFANTTGESKKNNCADTTAARKEGAKTSQDRMVPEAWKHIAMAGWIVKFCFIVIILVLIWKHRKSVCCCKHDVIIKDIQCNSSGHKIKIETKQNKHKSACCCKIEFYVKEPATCNCCGNSITVETDQDKQTSTWCCTHEILIKDIQCNPSGHKIKFGIYRENWTSSCCKLEFPVSDLLCKSCGKKIRTTTYQKKHPINKSVCWNEQEQAKINDGFVKDESIKNSSVLFKNNQSISSENPRLSQSSTPDDVVLKSYASIGHRAGLLPPIQNT